jgi:hypothetical protein
MGGTCKENCTKSCYCFSNGKINTISNQESFNKNFESRLPQLGQSIEENQFKRKIPEQVLKYITDKKYKKPDLIIINENVFEKGPIKLIDNNDIYKGSWNENIEKEGYGQYYMETEQKFFEGTWEKNKLIHGRIFYQNGDMYEGFIKDFNCQGKGIIVLKSGDKYIGDFNEGRREGKGKYIYSDRTTYEGQFMNNKFHGHGVMKWTTDEIYEGEFSQGYFNNQGKLIGKNGEQYEGNFKNNYYDGQGKYTFEDGSTYEGSYVLSLRNGKGIFIKKNNEFSYEGDWVDDYANGSGTFIKGDASIEGTWQNGLYGVNNGGQSEQINNNILNFSSKIPNINLIPRRLPHMNKN